MDLKKILIGCFLAITIVIGGLYLSVKQKQYLHLLNQSKLSITDLKWQLNKSLQYSNCSLKMDSINSGLFFCLFVPDITCQSCMNRTTQLFKELSDKICKNNTFLFANYDKSSSIAQYSRAHNIKSIIIKGDDNMSSIFKCSYPIFFIYNGTTQSSSYAYIPLKDTELTKSYLSFIYEQFQ